MTVIAWDGRTLAADKRMSSCGMARTITKIRKFGVALLGMTGNLDHAQELMHWFCEHNAEPQYFPESARKDEATLIVITKEFGIETYCSSPHPIRLEAKKAAFGSGRDYAEAAMYFDHTAYEAVLCAMNFETGCGNGIDCLELD
jgi:ATP-dependent protease HslVU (ClpYQ) peptidase subunit